MAPSSPDFAALKVILLLLAIVEIAAGVLLVFGARPIAALAPADLRLLPVFATGLLLMVFGILALAFGYLMYLASRDPVRYVGVIDALIFVLFAGAFLGLYATFALHVLSGVLVWSGTVVRFLLAIVLLVLRPRDVRAAGRSGGVG